jgi:hypothetical protein
MQSTSWRKRSIWHPVIPKRTCIPSVAVASLCNVIRSYLEWLKLSDQFTPVILFFDIAVAHLPSSPACRYKQALESASLLQDSAKSAAGKLRSQEDSFSSHKQAIEDSIEKLRHAQFKLTSWKYAVKLLM